MSKADEFLPKVITKLNTLYTLVNTDILLAAPTTRRTRVEVSLSSNETPSISYGSIKLFIDPARESITVTLVTRSNSGPKGVGKHLLYLAAAKAADMGYFLEFTAVPNNRGAEKLTSYYNSLGFQKTGEANEETGHQSYSTSANVLKEKIATYLQSGGKRRRQQRRVTRKKSKTEAS